jgi:hypothetical protein
LRVFARAAFDQVNIYLASMQSSLLLLAENRAIKLFAADTFYD